MQRKQIQKFNRAVGRRIRIARESRSMTVEQLAEMAEVSADRLRRDEAGQRSPTIPELERIADAVRLPLWHFLEDCVFCGGFVVESATLKRRGSGRSRRSSAATPASPR